MKRIILCALLALCLCTSALAEGQADAYQPLLDTWREMLATAEGDETETVNPACLYSYSETDYTNDEAVGYALLDLNADGVEELVIGEVAGVNYLPGMIYDIYTLQDGAPVLALRGWERNRYYLCTDGSIVNEASDGASSSMTNVYKFVDGAMTFQYGIVYDGTATEPWRLTSSEDGTVGEPMAEADAQAQLDALTAQYAQVDLLPFAEADAE